MKTRFCPSPTGYMHLGNTRTALFNALAAVGSQGTFLVRIEDTDRTRSSVEFAEILLEDMRWLGLHWQEGPGVGGPHSPYNQSERQKIYDQYYSQLEKHNVVYPCFCTDAQLEVSRKLQQAAGHPPKYAGTCKKLTAQDIADKKAQGLHPTLRFEVPRNQTIEFFDLVRGMQRFQSDDIGDFIIRRADGSASFFFSNAVDDAVMGVTHALRGEDHLTNTPRQILILQALGLVPPTYGHISLIIGDDNAPLSKRNGSLSVRELRDMGYLPEALNNYLARLGHYYDNTQFMDFQTLAKNFSTDSLGGNPAHYDKSQLLHWQKEAVAHCDEAKLWDWFGNEVHQIVTDKNKRIFIDAVRHNVVFPEDALHWAKIFFTGQLDYSTEMLAVLKNAHEHFFVTAVEAIEKDGIDFKAVSQSLQQQLNVKGKALFQPLRVALTGQLDGPEMQHIFAVLDKDGLKKRLNSLLEIIITN